MILTTTNSIEGYKIADYLGIVTGVSINEKIISGFSISKQHKGIQNSIDSAKEAAFQPLIEGRNRDGFYTIETRYHLAFEERRTVLEPMIEFYKFMLDYFE